MSMKQAGGNRKPGGSSGSAAAASGAGGGGGAGGRQSLGRGRNTSKGTPAATPFNGVYANMRMVHILTSVVGTKCELKVRNGVIYEGIFKTYGPECDVVLDAAHRKSPEPSAGPRKEDIVESIIFKSSDVVVVHFKDVDLNFAKKVPTEADNFTDSAVSARVNGEHKEKDLEPWDGGEQHATDSLESLDTDLSNGWDPDDMFKYNEEQYGIKSTYDSSLSSYTVALERDNSEEFLKREARAAALADEIESSATYKARVALENDERSEEEKFTAVVRGGEREGHPLNRENKYIPPGQRNLSWGSGRQNSPRLAQCSPGPHTPRSAPHDYSSSPNMDQRVVNGGPPRMSPKSQRTPRTHRVPSCRGGGPPGGDFLSHNAPGEASAPPAARSSPSGGTWSSVVSGAHRPRSPRQNSLGGASPGSSAVSAPQTGTAPVDSVATPMTAGSPIAASPASNLAATPSAEAKEPRVQEARQNSPTANKENVKPTVESSASMARTVSKGPPSMAPDHRKQIDNLKRFSVDFRLQSSSNPDPVFDAKTGPGEKPKEPPLDKGPADSTGSKADSSGRDETSTTPVATATTPNMSTGTKTGAPSPSPSPLGAEQKRSPDVTSQGVQTSTPASSGGAAKPDGKDDKEEKKDPVPENIRKSTLNPNAKEFNPRAFCTPPKPATPTLPRPQGQPSPSIVVQQPPTVYGQPVCFPQMYPLTPVSPGVQKSIIWKPPAMYHVQVPHMTVSQSKPYRPGKVPNMPQQRPEQHHPQGTSAMMHPANAAGPPIVAPSPAYQTQYFTCSPQQFASQQLVQQMPHYQSQAQHVFSPVMQGGARMMTPPAHGQPTLVSTSAAQYGEQTHTMYVSAAPIPQQYQHPNATLHAHPQHPQPSATPTGQGQQGGQHGGNHPAPSPVQHQHTQHQAQQAALHLGNSQQQQMYSALAPTPPSMTPGPNPQSPQGNFPSAQQAVYLHPQQVQHGYNPSHMAHMQQAHMQSGMHHAQASHPMMLMATQPPGGPQQQLPQNALNPIPVSSTTHFSYMAHAPVQQHHQQQL
ncbi:ataxin-2 isoform X8 [Clupea harengus]|uniref:Ataxin-2 isoform X8 n=1 Tax=Clupea harengus TaxID=7950 RepID=A0A6P3VPM0_CLUHA|nr:ataxin-2 isoform X8 [Clupea harengus]